MENAIFLLKFGTWALAWDMDYGTSTIVNNLIHVIYVNCVANKTYSIINKYLGYLLKYYYSLLSYIS